MKKRVISLLLAGSILFTMSACGKKTAVVDEKVEKTTSDSYPLDTDVTIQWWLQLQSGVTATATSLNDTEFHD